MVVLALSIPCTVSAQEGIFAEFNTSMGSYTCKLEYVLAPKACANFIGLATGERPWLDLTTGEVRTDSFFAGTTFHRVIADFMNQGGSRNGLGTDGPGYAFQDEFDPSLTHTGFGVLSCANSGPNSNGSQFFVTVATASHLNNVHTVFGRLTGGSNVVYEINQVQTDGAPPGGGYKPLTNVVLNSVVIRREGAAANAFDIHAQGLPDVMPLTASIAREGGDIRLTHSDQLYADTRLYSSSNLTDWVGTEVGIEVELPVVSEVIQPMTNGLGFYRLAQIQYPSSTFAPADVLNETYEIVFDNVDGSTNTLTFDSSGGGSYSWNIYLGGWTNWSGSITSYTWMQQPYHGLLWPVIFSGPASPMTLNLNFTNATQGTYQGTYYSSNPFPIYGHFRRIP